MRILKKRYSFSWDTNFCNHPLNLAYILARMIFLTLNARRIKAIMKRCLAKYASDKTWNSSVSHNAYPSMCLPQCQSSFDWALFRKQYSHKSKMLYLIMWKFLMRKRDLLLSEEGKSISTSISQFSLDIDQQFWANDVSAVDGKEYQKSSAHFVTPASISTTNFVVLFSP